MLSAGIRNPGAGFTQYVLEVLRIRFLLDPAPEREPLPKELELLGSGSLLESDPPMEPALFWVCTSLILIQEAPISCDFMQSELN